MSSAIHELFSTASYPEILRSMEFDLNMLDREPRPLDLIDGHILPRGTVTLIATDAGSGKSTSAIVSSISAAYDGEWKMFGYRKHGKPLRSAVVLGEDNDRSFESVISGLPGDTKNKLRAARQAERIFITPFRKWARTQESPNFFDKEGALSESGRMFVRAMRDFQPDVIVLDTVTSLSQCPYLDKGHAYRTINALNDLADELDCAILLMMHLTKEGGYSINANVTADELTNKIAGSAGWKSAARHAIAMAPCPAGKFDNIELADERDSKWIAAIKTNVLVDAAKGIFPVVRSRREMLLKTTDETGTPLLDADTEAEQAVQERLRKFVVDAIRAAAELRTPFAQSAKNKFGVPQLCTGALADISVHATPAQYESALAALERMGKIVACKSSRAGGSVVWDTPDGPFANEAEYEAAYGQKLEFRKGAPSAAALEQRIAEIRGRDPEQLSELSLTRAEPVSPHATDLDELASDERDDGDGVPF